MDFVYDYITRRNDPVPAAYGNGPEGVLLKPAPVFAETRPEDVFGSIAWDGPPGSLEDMEAGVLEEAKPDGIHVR